MSHEVYFVSDLHYSHRKVIEFEDRFRAKALDVDTIEEHDALITERIVSTLPKDSILYILGDVGSVEKCKTLIKEVKSAQVVFLPGNHDSISAIKDIGSIPKVSVVGDHKRKGYWITHIPIHPNELYGSINIHGHVHSKDVDDDRYINLSIERTKGWPISFSDIKSGKFTRPV